MSFELFCPGNNTAAEIPPPAILSSVGKMKILPLRGDLKYLFLQKSGCYTAMLQTGTL